MIVYWSRVPQSSFYSNYHKPEPRFVDVRFVFNASVGNVFECTFVFVFVLYLFHFVLLFRFLFFSRFFFSIFLGNVYVGKKVNFIPYLFDGDDGGVHVLLLHIAGYPKIQKYIQHMKEGNKRRRMNIRGGAKIS